LGRRRGFKRGGAGLVPVAAVPVRSTGARSCGRWILILTKHARRRRRQTVASEIDRFLRRHRAYAPVRVAGETDRFLDVLRGRRAHALGRGFSLRRHADAVTVRCRRRHLGTLLLLASLFAAAWSTTELEEPSQR
ncbi:unnamed protein product, partial [Ectocarpus sp. 12 AP-2014]